MKVISDSGLNVISDSGQSDHRSERSDAGVASIVSAVIHLADASSVIDAPLLLDRIEVLLASGDADSGIPEMLLVNVATRASSVLRGSQRDLALFLYLDPGLVTDASRDLRARLLREREAHSDARIRARLNAFALLVGGAMLLCFALLMYWLCLPSQKGG